MRYGNTVNDLTPRLPQQVAVMANSLYHSLQGQYFVGYADNLFFDKSKSAWGALTNPIDSGVNLYVNVWTVTQLSSVPLQIELWLNADLPGEGTVSRFTTPTNTAIRPMPVPKVRLTQASNVTGQPEGGAIAYTRISIPYQTLADEEDGKFIVPPGGNFAVFLANPETAGVPANFQIAFGWWEEKICDYYYQPPVDENLH